MSTSTSRPVRFDAAKSAEITFLPLADPERRAAHPLRALQAAHDLKIMLGLTTADAVRFARADGDSWQTIGNALGISRQAAHEQFSYIDPVDAQESLEK